MGIRRNISNCGNRYRRRWGLERTLFIDDSEPILDAAKAFGLRYCLGVTNPDSGQQEKSFARHPAMNDYLAFLPALRIAQQAS